MLGNGNQSNTIKMKEIRQINNIVSVDYTSGDTDNSDTVVADKLGISDSEPEYYRQVIRPMLTPGHENELVYWMKDLGLIKNEFMCRNAKFAESCSKMSWIASRVNDMYQWKCNGCSEKRSIRDESIFVNVKCSFKNAIRILLGWCKGNDIELMAKILGLKNTVVAGFYRKAAIVAEKYITSHLSEWKLGGPGVIVLVDCYPEGCTTDNRFPDGRPILCLSEVKSFPQKYWLEPLDTYRSNNHEQINSIRQHILDMVKKLVFPGTILITPSFSTLCPTQEFYCLRNLYPVIVSTEELSRHNNPKQTLSDNLNTIWKEVAEVCAAAQLCSSENVRQCIIGHLWRKRYSEAAFEMLVYRLGL